MYYFTNNLLKHRIGIIFGRSTIKISEKNLLSKINYRYQIGDTNRCITLNRRSLPVRGLVLDHLAVYTSTTVYISS